MSRTVKQALVVLLFLFAGLSASAQSRVIYSDTADAHADIAQAIRTAAKTHKHIILDFGGNWCGDCQVLNIYFHQPPNLQLLEDNFVLVHIEVSRVPDEMTLNTDIAAKYQVSLKHGVPVLAVLDERGRLLYSHKNGGFDAVVRTDPASVTQFLNQWKPKR